MLVAGATSIGCGGGATAPGASDAVLGIYLLQGVDGLLLGQSIDPALGCPQGIASGILDLVPQVGDQLPIFEWSFCNVSGADQSDVGNWKLVGGSLSFTSLKSNNSRYEGTINTAVQPLSLSISKGGHVYSFRLVRPRDSALGTLRYLVRDNNGAAVDLVALQVIASDGLVAGGTIISGGEFRISGPPGSWQVNTTPPPGYTLMQPNPTLVDIQVNTISEVTVVLQKTP